MEPFETPSSAQVTAISLLVISLLGLVYGAVNEVVWVFWISIVPGCVSLVIMILKRLSGLWFFGGAWATVAMTLLFAVLK